MENYVLDANGDPVPETDVLAWGRWMATADRGVRRTEVPGGGFVSTVFLGLDHNGLRLSDPNRKPLLYETMVFDVPTWEDYQRRYATREEALAGHEATVALVLRGPLGSEEGDE